MDIRAAEISKVIRDQIGTRRIRGGDQVRQPVGMDQVVAVHDSDPRTARGIQCPVARGRGPCVPRRGDDLHPVIGRGDPAGDGQAVIVRGIVGQDQLQPPFGLGQDRGHRAGQMRRTPEIGHHHRYHGRRHAFRPVRLPDM